MAQSFSDFELILIDDGSTDASPAIAGSFAGERRVRIVDCKRRTGVAAALAAGLEVARGEYIARHDADDWSESQRFAKQVRLLDECSGIALCGTYAWDVLAGGVRHELKRQVSTRDIRIDALFRMPVLTTTTMARRAYFVTYGCEEAGWTFCGDYAALAASLDPCGFANIPEFLMSKRVHASSLTQSAPRPEIAVADRAVKRRIIEILGVMPSDEDMRKHDLLATLSEAEQRGQDSERQDGHLVRGLPEWCDRLLEGNARRRLFDQSTLSTVLREKSMLLRARLSMMAE